MARRDLILGEHVGEAVGAEQEEVTRERVQGEDVGLHGGLGSERACDRRALRVALGLLGGEDTALDELGDERMVGRHLLEPAVPKAVAPGVADVADRDRFVRRIDQRDGDRRPHPRRGRIGE